MMEVYFEMDVHLLKKNTYFLFIGFDKAQAETIVSALTTLSNVSLDTIYKEMVTQAQQVIFPFLSLDSLIKIIFHNPPSVHTCIFLIVLSKGTRIL